MKRSTNQPTWMHRSSRVRKRIRHALNGWVMLTVLMVSGLCNAGNQYHFNDNGTYDIYYVYKNGDEHLVATSVPCIYTDPGPSDPALHFVYLRCEEEGLAELDGYEKLLGLPPPAPLQSKSTTGTRSAMQRTTTIAPPPISRAVAQTNSSSTTLALSSSTPLLPFLGNPLTMVSFVPNASTPANVTAVYAVGLRRQPDCSMSEDFVLPGAATPNAGLIATLPSAEVYLHQLAGLTTTPDVFAQGCGYPVLGQPSNSVALLQPTSDGGSIVAGLSGSLFISVDDPVANTLTSTTLLPSGTNSSLSAFAAAQLTSSGNMDLVATLATDPATQRLSTVVFLGNGDGTFKPGVYYNVAGDITIDDVNGDGIPDIVICSTGVTTLIGKGDGTFTPSAPSATSITCGGAPGEIVTGDFNGDGKKDLLVQGAVLLGNGDGTFTVGSPISTNASYFAGQFGNTAVGNVNNDGKLDLVISAPNFVAVFYGNGDGTFTAGPRYTSVPGPVPVNLTDLDGDGNLDIVLGQDTSGIFTAYCCQPPLMQILMGRGDGTFVDSVAYNQGSYGNGVYTVAGPQIATADFNGDGEPDALVFYSSNFTVPPIGLTLLPGDGTGNLGAPITSPLNVNPRMLVSADMNHDGKPDAVVGTNTGVSVLLNQGNGTFAGEQDYALPSPVVSLVTGDFNGDGIMDVAAGVNPGLSQSGPSGVYVLFGQANGTLAAPVKIDSSLNPTGLTAADINGDGKSDLVVADQGFFDYAGASDQINGAVHVYLGNANGTFTTAASPTTPATNYSVAALGDLNGDGKLDLILAGNVAGTQGSTSPYVYTLLGNGDGTFKSASAVALVGNYGIGSTSIVLADFNHDGHLDVVVGDATANTSVLLGNGDGTLVVTQLALGQQPAALAAVDLAQDNYPDLLVGTTDTYGNANLAVFLSSTNWAAAASLPATTTILTTSAASITTGQSLTLTATVAAASGSTTPGGTVSFLDGSTTLGTGTLGASGTATYTTTALTAGSQSLTASYGGSATLAGSVSSAVTVTVAAGAADFTAALSPTSGTLSPGQSATTTITLTPSNGFNQTVALSCSGLPTGASCRFSSASVAVNGSAATSTLTIATAATTAMNSTRSPLIPLAPGGGLFAGIGLPLVLRRRRSAVRWLRRALFILSIVGAAAVLQSCGGSGGGGGASGTGSSAGTPAGTYTVTVTATAGSTTHSATYSLTVS